MGTRAAFVNIDRSCFPDWITLALDWNRYKHLCDLPDTFSRWMLEQTAELVSEKLKACLSAAAEAPLVKPADHHGGQLTDMFQLRLDVADVRAIHDKVAAAVSAGATTSRTSERGLGGFEEAWREYLEALEAPRELTVVEESDRVF